MDSNSIKIQQNGSNDPEHSKWSKSHPNNFFEKQITKRNKKASSKLQHIVRKVTVGSAFAI